MKTYLYNVTENYYRECDSCGCAIRLIRNFMRGVQDEQEIHIRMIEARKEGCPLILHYGDETLICFFRKAELKQLIKELNIKKRG